MKRKLRKVAFVTGTSTGLGWLFFTYLFYSETGELPAYTAQISPLLLSLIAANLVGLGIRLFSRLLSSWLPWQRTTTLRLLAGVVGNSLLAWLIPLACLWIYMMVVLHQPDVRSWLGAHNDTVLKWLILTCFGIFSYTLISFLRFSYNRYAAMQIEAVQLTRMQLALQMELLKSQLSPHYLFNSLNTISSLAHRDAHLAEQFIRQLARTYQYVLSTHDQPLVSLSEELEFVRAYTFLLKVRFEEAIQVQVGVPKHLMQRSVPPLTVQMLLENAVKHNTITEEAPLKVHIYTDEHNYLNVSNNCQQKTSLPPKQSLKVGIENIRQRYHHLTNQQIEIIRDDHYTVRLPLLTG